MNVQCKKPLNSPMKNNAEDTTGVFTLPSTWTEHKDAIKSHIVFVVFLVIILMMPHYTKEEDKLQH